jgi:hypothetical protein
MTVLFTFCKILQLLLGNIFVAQMFQMLENLILVQVILNFPRGSRHSYTMLIFQLNENIAVQTKSIGFDIRHRVESKYKENGNRLIDTQQTATSNGQGLPFKHSSFPR